jgi:ABC-type phosphate transport system substrate-binding protein
MNMRYAPSRLAAMILVMMAWTGVAAAGDLVVIVNPASGVEQLSREQAVNIFMGRYRKLPSGIVAFPIDVGSQTQQRKQFYQRLVSKDLPEIDAYWARLVFSGQTSPPLQVPDERTAVQLVAGNRSAIAYVERDQVDPRVKVVFEVEPR